MTEGGNVTGLVDYRTLQAVADLRAVEAEAPAAERLADALFCGAPAAEAGPVEVAGPPRVRAALANGLRAMGADADLPRRVFVSTDRAAITATLAGVARAMTDAELEHIARADYGCGAERHLAVLRALLARDDCRLAPGEGWYPFEAVELVAHVAGQPGFAGATALVMIAALHDGDAQGDMEFRWQNLAAAYAALPAPVPAALHAGLRHLYESAPGWNPWTGALFDPADHDAALIPPAEAGYLLPGPGTA